MNIRIHFNNCSFQVCDVSKADDNRPETNQQTTDHSPEEDDADDGESKSGDKDTTQSSYFDQTDSLHRLRQSFFKRALSYPIDPKNTKVPKIEEKIQDDDSSSHPHEPTDYAEATSADRQRNVTTSSVHTADTSTPEHPGISDNQTNTDSKENVSDTVHSVQGYNPYAAWALDPRFAMFMRNGFMQTYQGFVSMYSHPDNKDA